MHGWSFTLLLGVTVLSGKFRVQKVDQSADPILRNLFELYLHDMAEWFEFDTSSEGSFSFPTQQEVWDKALQARTTSSLKIPKSRDKYLSRDDSSDLNICSNN